MTELSIPLLFDNQLQPLISSPGQHQWDLPQSYQIEKYQAHANTISSRFTSSDEEWIPIKEIAIPDLSVPLQLSRTDTFSLFAPAHQKMAAYLIMLFLGMRTADDLLSLAVYCRDRINSQMFTYALTVAILHRPDTKKLRLPQLNEIFPDKFMDSRIFFRAREESNILPDALREPIEIPMDYTGTNADPEHRVAYWREDIGVNLHHWHWHLVYPFSGPLEVIDKDRRGELFYYMHHQTMARYNVERMCNDLGRTRPLENLREPIAEGYFPKLDQIVSGRAWPSRPRNMMLSDVNRTVEGLTFALEDLEYWREVLLEAIRTRRMKTSDGKEIYLDDFTGIDILGNAVEASPLSPDMSTYGSFHNLGHLAIATMHDPDHRYLEPFAVMGDAATAMRDPIFYRWHQHVDDIFAIFKNSITPYSSDELSFPGVAVTDVHVNLPGANLNTFNTFWSKSIVDLSRGLDFAPKGEVLARFQHLNHEPFKYYITVHNTNDKDVLGTVRIFLAPRYNEQGAPLYFNEQRMLMIELDKFTARLKRGLNLLERESADTAVTIPFETTFRNLNHNRPDVSNRSATEEYNFCGCGWPHHMHLPKGTIEGYPMDLFVMISDFDYDRVDQEDPIGCADGISYCGLKDRKYPDARSMGFPFDRSAHHNVRVLSDFLTPNMRVQQVNVKFHDVVTERRNLSRSYGG
ncbi:hypothetical protein QAD02_015109 [Eretmocerus hayati]|uniref:Uncharacterized protein n=1 Tax=Eretmocerus hayati TaxID=131215 RepID=A0ACC2P7B4_9HYME|nr:hypothetical protein QAD02_015109 [Eretmocerus hayati]